MKKIIKNIAISLNLEDQWRLYLRKCEELELKLLLKTNKAKEEYIKNKFKESLGYEIDFNKKPETFNEKIQFRKLYDNNSLYPICSDKYRVREYVKNKIGEEYLVPLFLVTDKLTEEQWDSLPDKFVAKANHNSGPVQIIKDKSKVNKKEIIRKLNNQLKIDYGIRSLEKYYSDIPRKIIVEKYLKDNIEDYRFHVFRKASNIKVIVQRTNSSTETSNMYEGSSFKKLNFGNGYSLDFTDYEKPKNYGKMLEIAKKLAQDFDYVRVDLYNMDGKIYFGELTFCDGRGLGKFSPEQWDLKLGSYWGQKIKKN